MGRGGGRLLGMLLLLLLLVLNLDWNKRIGAQLENRKRIVRIKEVRSGRDSYSQIKKEWK
jgi:hypothetical protein